MFSTILIWAFLESYAVQHPRGGISVWDDNYYNYLVAQMTQNETDERAIEAAEYAAELAVEADRQAALNDLLDNVTITDLVVNQLNQELESDPFKLVDIDCNQIQHWQTLAQFIPPQSVLDKLSGLNSVNVQNINDAEGAVVNMDYFPVVIDRLPNNPNTGQQFTADEFLGYIRKNINNFVNTNLSRFLPSTITGFNEESLWESNSPLGAIISIDIPQAHDGSVVCSNYNITSNPTDNDSWTFTTIEMPWGITQGLDGPHPVSGNRQFGYVFNPNDGPNGSYTFFTRGVDRIESAIDEELANFLSGGSPFQNPDALWSSFVTKIQDFTNTNGGIGNVAPISTSRPDWQKVKDVLLGNKPISDLGCN